MKNKIIIFKSQAEHFWYSCRIIEEHILKAFNQSGLDYEIYECKDSLFEFQLKKLSEETRKLHFYFLSDFIKQQNICQQLRDNGVSGTFYIPIYGNMTVEIYRWNKLGEILKDQKVYLIGASPRSCRQIQAFVNADVREIPFCFEAELEKDLSTRESIELVYAGRITPQKNVFELLKAFHDAFQFNPKLHLHIAGEFHERMFHLHGYKLDYNEYVQQIKSLLSHPGITYHQNLKQHELLKLYQKCDYFISMSTYHDEDFGMSACQASVLGLGLILSDWGGQGAYKENSLFVPVTVNDISIPMINSSILLKTLAGLTKPPHYAFKYQTHFSYKSFIERIKLLMEQEPQSFTGLTPLYQKYADLGVRTFPFANLDKSSEKRAFYLSIYQSYLSDI